MLFLNNAVFHHFFSLHQLFCDCDYSNKCDYTAGQNSAVLTSLLNPLPDQKSQDNLHLPLKELSPMSLEETNINLDTAGRPKQRDEL